MLEKKLLPNKNKPFVLLRRSLAFHRSRLLFLQYYNQLLRCKPTRTEYTIQNHIEIHGTGIRVNLWKWLVYQCAVTTSLCVRKHSWLVKIWNKNINTNKKEIIGKNDILYNKQYRTRRVKTFSVLHFFMVFVITNRSFEATRLIGQDNLFGHHISNRSLFLIRLCISRILNRLAKNYNR